MVALAGGIAIAFGVQHFVKALREKYKEDIRYTRAAQRLDPGAAFIFLTPPMDPRQFRSVGGLRYALGLDMDKDAPGIFATAPGYPVASMTFMTPIKRATNSLAGSS